MLKSIIDKFCNVGIETITIMSCTVMNWCDMESPFSGGSLEKIVTDFFL